MFAHMPTGQGRVGLFLSFSFYLEVLDRILVLRGLEAAGQQPGLARVLTDWVALLWPLPFIPKEYISSRGRALSVPLSTPLTFVRRRGDPCMVPSPLCGRLVTLVNFISKTRIKSHNFIKSG